MTSKDKNLIYALVMVAGVGIAVWAGLPLTFLFLLICPVMMFFMMRGMGGTGSGHRGEDSSSEKVAAAKRSAAPASGSHDRITSADSSRSNWPLDEIPLGGMLDP